MPARKLGKTTIGRLQAEAQTMGEGAVGGHCAGPTTSPASAPAAVNALAGSRDADRVVAGSGGLDAPVAALVRRCSRRAAICRCCATSRTLEAEGRLENLEELVGVAAEYDQRAAAMGAAADAVAGDEPQTPLDGFLQEVSLYTDVDKLTTADELVTFMTLHNAKGLEFPVVFIAGMEEGVFPHQRSIDEQNLEEERRLAYVGITRAMDRLYLLHARSRNLWGGSMYGLPSRFLAEIPASLVEMRSVGALAAGLRRRRALERRGRPRRRDCDGASGWAGSSRGIPGGRRRGDSAAAALARGASSTRVALGRAGPRITGLERAPRRSSTNRSSSSTSPPATACCTPRSARAS